MFDLHSHIIPGIDDGSQDMDTSLNMLRMAVSHGTTNVVVTPHVIEGNWLPSWERILEGWRGLRDTASKAGLKLQIYPGAEVALSMDILERLTTPGAYCINEGSYLLVELPALEIPPYTEDFFFKLQARGITPVLAHPERNREVGQDLERLREWIEKGVLVQMNAPSLNGRMGPQVQVVAETLLCNGMVHCIGSDAHGVRSRRPILSEAAEKIKDMKGADVLARLVRDNPSRIIGGEPVEISVPERIRPLKRSSPVKSWLINLFGKKHRCR